MNETPRGLWKTHQRSKVNIMKKVLTILALTAALSTASANANAEFVSGVAIKEGLNNGSVATIGYVFGAADALNGSVWCPPKDLQAETMVLYVAETIKKIPNKTLEGVSGDVAVGVILKAAFPCPKETRL